jgi:hypothetical protein
VISKPVRSSKKKNLSRQPKENYIPPVARKIDQNLQVKLLPRFGRSLLNLHTINNQKEGKA